MWAAATASTQIESAAFEDGKGLSNWDIYPTINNVVYQNQSPNDGCDHYHHVEEDVALTAKLGLKGYRFSFAWPRIIPNGEKSRDLNGRQGGVERGLRNAATDLRPSPGVWRGLPPAPRLG